MGVLLSLPLVKEILVPLLADLFIKLMIRYRADPEFMARVDAAAEFAKISHTEGEKLNASTKVQDALFPRS